jgi:hypothetical protein
MKIRVKEPVEHDGKPLQVGKIVDLPKDQAEALVACGAAEDPDAAEKAAARARDEAKAKANELDELKAKAKAWDDAQPELEQLRAKAALFDALPEDVRTKPAPKA